MVLALGLTVACVDMEASDIGKEHFCGGMAELGERVRDGEAGSPQDVRTEFLGLVIQAQQSPDEDFIADVQSFSDSIEAGTRPSDQLTDDISDACSRYADIDAVF